MLDLQDLKVEAFHSLYDKRGHAGLDFTGSTVFFPSLPLSCQGTSSVTICTEAT